MCMIYEQCNYSILLLLYDFEMENVEIKQTWNLKHVCLKGMFPLNVTVYYWQFKSQWILECFHTRADSKLQWWIVIAIFELPSVHTREKTSPSLQFSIPEQGEEADFFVLRTCWLLFHLRYKKIILQNALSAEVTIKRSRSSAQNSQLNRSRHSHGDFPAWFEIYMHHWKTPPDHHLNCAIPISLCDGNLRTHGPKCRH